ncbi:MAG: hypothetical protein JWP11_1159 [Frankiales bacterium]|nr:hypothetical protein [Frankiales bacterium]
MTSPTLPLCPQCGQPSEVIDGTEADICPSCREAPVSERPAWSALEIAGVVGLLLGSACIVIAIVAVVVRG